MRIARLTEKISHFLYRKIYNREKYKKFIQLPPIHAIIYPLYSLFNFFYFQRVLKFYKKNIEKLPKGTQVFFMGRRDFGTHLYGLHYLRLWKMKRGNVCLLIFTNEHSHIKKLAKLLLPDVPVLYPDSIFDYLVAIFFGHYYVFFHTFLPVYAHLATQRPDFLHMFDLAESKYARYNSFLDPILADSSTSSFSPEFLETYKLMREQFDYRWDVFTDCCLLNYSSHLPKLELKALYYPLRENLKIKQPYVILNINAKNYSRASARRRINYPQRYNCLIDSLIEMGYDVVLQGREEQPVFTSRKGLINYAKSSFCTIENDLILYSECSFVISSKSGVEIFATICNVPILGLNYTEILGLQPSKKMRFYPKLLRDPLSGKIFTWKEHLTSPVFFEIGTNKFSRDVEYIDMEEKEMLEALEEFLPLLSRSEEEWLNYTDLQKQFKSVLTPMHLELFLSKAVPCNAYLRKTAEKNNQDFPQECPASYD